MRHFFVVLLIGLVAFSACGEKKEVYSIPEYTKPTFSAKHLWFSNLRVPVDAPDGYFLKAGSYSRDGDVIQGSDGLYTYAVEYVSDPRLTDWWDDHAEQPLTSLEETVARCARSEEYPDVTTEIIQDMERVVGSPLLGRPMTAEHIKEVMTEYTLPALYAKTFMRFASAPGVSFTSTN